MTLRPWRVIRELRIDVRAARHSCAANAKRANRLTRRIRVLDLACAKHKQQERHDQAYIDALEDRLDDVAIAAAREEISGG